MVVCRRSQFFLEGSKLDQRFSLFKFGCHSDSWISLIFLNNLLQIRLYLVRDIFFLKSIAEYGVEVFLDKFWLV